MYVIMYVKLFSTGNKWSVDVSLTLSPSLYAHHPSQRPLLSLPFLNMCCPDPGPRSLTDDVLPGWAQGRVPIEKAVPDPGVCFETFLCSYFKLELPFLLLCLWHCRLSLHIPPCIREFRVWPVSWIILPSLHQSVKELPQSYGLRPLEPLLHSLSYSYFYFKNYVGIVLRVKKFYSDYDEK